ncbi:hypothetical protein KC330_g8092 [Hortaea werneckii]|nr:hypothetical protein KC330_g8092 [Hortaea werneckii]
MPKPYGQRGRPHDVWTNEHGFKHLHGTATAARQEGSRNRQPMVDRAWSRDLAAGGRSGQKCPPTIRFSYGAAYGERNPRARPPGVAPAHDGYTPGENRRLLYNQFQRDMINIKYRGHQ